MQSPHRQSTALAWRSAGVAVLLIFVLQGAGHALQLSLRYERTALLHGLELWRVVTGHLVHLSWHHALLNAGGLLLCCSLAPMRFKPRRLALDWLLLASAISSMLWVFSPAITYYVGLSGVLYGFYVLGLAPGAWRGERISQAALLTLLGWMAWQIVAGPSLAEEQQIGGSIVTEAHLYGVVAATVLLAVEWSVRRCSPARYRQA